MSVPEILSVGGFYFGMVVMEQKVYLIHSGSFRKVRIVFQ